jgi:hypothetical protein
LSGTASCQGLAHRLAQAGNRPRARRAQDFSRASTFARAFAGLRALNDAKAQPMERRLRSGQPYFFIFFFFFDFLKPTPPGFSFRAAICIGAVVDVDFMSAVSVTAVEPAAWADSDKATRPAAPRSALRTNDFMVRPP